MTNGAPAGTGAMNPPVIGKKREHIIDIAERDSKKLCNPDFNKPFANLEDALDRLLPYHLLAGEDVSEADDREAHEGGAPLVVSRHDAWLAQATRRAGEMQRSAYRLSDKIATLEKSALDRDQLAELVLYTYAASDAKYNIETEKERKEQVIKAAKAAETAAAAAEAAKQLAEAQAAAVAVEEAAVKAEQEKAAAEAAAAAVAPPPPVAAPAVTQQPTAAAPVPAPAAEPPKPDKKEDARSKLLASMKQFTGRR